MITPSVVNVACYLCSACGIDVKDVSENILSVVIVLSVIVKAYYTIQSVVIRQGTVIICFADYLISVKNVGLVVLLYTKSRRVVLESILAVFCKLSYLRPFKIVALVVRLCVIITYLGLLFFQRRILSF